MLLRCAGKQTQGADFYGADEYLCGFQGTLCGLGFVLTPLGCASPDVHPLDGNLRAVLVRGGCPLIALAVGGPVAGRAGNLAGELFTYIWRQLRLALQKLHDYSPKLSGSGTVILMLISKHQIKR